MDIVVLTVISVVAALVFLAVVFLGGQVVLTFAVDRWARFVAAVGLAVGGAVGAVGQLNGLLPGGPLPGGAEPDGMLGLAIGVPCGMILGYGIGAIATPSIDTRRALVDRLQPLLFVGPAVAFVVAGLVVPSVQTFGLSFRSERRGGGEFSLIHYRSIFGDDEMFNLDNVSGILTGRLVVVGAVVLGLAALSAWASANTLNARRSRLGAALTRLVVTLVAAVGALAVTGLIEGIARDPNRSVIFDRVLTPLVSSPAVLMVGVGLTVSALVAAASDRARGRSDTMDWSAPQASVGLVVAVVLFLFGVLSTLQSVLWNNLWWVVTVAGLSTVLGLVLAVLADRSKGEAAARTLIFIPMAISMVGAAVIWSFVFELRPTGAQTGLVNALLQGIGFQPRGFFINSSMIPWNSFWIMLIMVWAQTGFAMVILSSALKGVPEEYVEAAKVDGATEAQIFWRVLVPQIRSSIGVVLTTLVVVVMKVFDLVKATTGGANRTSVLANEMFDQLRDGNFARSSAFAVLIFVLTLPVMVLNARRSRRELT